MIEITSARPQGPRLIAALVRCCLVWLLAVWQLPGLAQPAQPSRDQRDHISARAWLDDPAGSLGPEQVRSMGWTPYTGPLRRGYTDSTTWLRLKIAPRQTQDSAAPTGRPGWCCGYNPVTSMRSRCSTPATPTSPHRWPVTGTTGDWAHTGRSTRNS